MGVQVSRMEASKENVTKAKAYKHVPAKDFLGSVKSEFKKITWTNRDELVVYTQIVVFATFFLGMGIYVMDLLIQSVLNTFSAFALWIFG